MSQVLEGKGDFEQISVVPSPKGLCFSPVSGREDCITKERAVFQSAFEIPGVQGSIVLRDMPQNNTKCGQQNPVTLGICTMTCVEWDCGTLVAPACQ